MLKVENISFSYGAAKVLENVSLTIENGKIYAIIGHTGSGKSTLVRHLNGLLRPQSGRVLLDGQEFDKSQMKAVRKRVGLVFQYPEQQLFAETVFDDIAFGPRNLGWEEERIRESVDAAAEAVSLSKDFYEKSPFNLSGGEKRRVALAGVLAMQPEILVLDEPSAGLDPGARREMNELLLQIHRDHPENSIVFVSHSMEETALTAEHIFVLDRGKLLTEGTPDEVFARDELLYHAGLGLPQAAELILELRRRGFLLNSAYTIPQAAKEIADNLLKNCK